MNIKRFYVSGYNWSLEYNAEGDLVQYSDHITALTAQHEDDMEFADFYKNIWGTKKEHYLLDYMTIEEVKSYWLDNVKNKLTNP